MLPTYSHDTNLTRRIRVQDEPNINIRASQDSKPGKGSILKTLINKFRNNVKLIFCFIILMALIIWFFNSIYFDEEIDHTTNGMSDDFFTAIAKQLTNPNQESEGSYGWYRKQLENNTLGNTRFSDSTMVKLGFQDTWTTSDSMFTYFRTYNTLEKCTNQHKGKVFGEKRADEVLKEVNLDAVLILCEYIPPFYLSSKDDELRNIEVLHKLIASEKDEKGLINKVDELYGETMWRGMRRLSIFMCSEAVLFDNIQSLIQNISDAASMRRYSESPADISVCYLSTCSVWVNYLYYPLELAKSTLFGTKPRSENSGVCAFVSNCKDGNFAKERYKTITSLAKYVPIRQYGRCGRNAQEGPGGKQYELENNCKFYFAAENSVSKDYITEKFFEGIKALQNGAKLLIIYRGASNIKDWGFPPSLFIDINDFKSADDLGAYLKELNDDDEKFEKRFAQITEADRKKVDEVLKTFQYKLGENIPCRITKSIGEVKLARYLLFKIGLKPLNNKLNDYEWNEFKSKFSFFEKQRIQTLDNIYNMAYGVFQKEGNYKNIFNSAWKFE